MLDFIVKALIFLLIITAVILVHEGGHFLIAKKNGIGVKEFYIGVGPTIFSRTYHGTRYSLHLFLVGGACVFQGDAFLDKLSDDDEDESDDDLTGDVSAANADLIKEELDEEDDDSLSFRAASVFSRMATVFAGPFSNFFLAFFLCLFIIGSIGYDPAKISGVMDGYPAAEAGLQAGDVITKLGSKKIVTYRDISSYTMFFEGKETLVEYERDGKKYTALLTPLYNQESGRYLFGISGAVGRVKTGPLMTIRYSIHEVYYWIDLTYKSLGMMFKGRFSKDDLAGPVGVAQVVGDVYDESKPDGAYYVWLNMMNLTVLLSANLGVMNLLPIPALDGGRLVFLIIEAIRRKRIDEDKEAMIHFAGIMVLLALMVLVMINDVTRFFR